MQWNREPIQVISVVGLLLPTCAMRERINLPGGSHSGTIPHLFGDSTSHHWGTGAASSLSDFMIGIRPSVGYQTWQVKRFPQGPQWAQGPAPTTAGMIASRWELGDDVVRLTVEAPDGTTGTAATPTLGATRTIYRDDVQA